MKLVKVFLNIFCATFLAGAAEYPQNWWAYVDPSSAPAWEVLPQQAKAGEVILSKRTELGIFSNFAPTNFDLNKKTYASIEGFWQMMKYPDQLLQNDPRVKERFPLTREQVANLAGFYAKDAGNAGSDVMEKLQINWVSFEGEKMIYRTGEKDRHYQLIKEAMKAKLNQTVGLKELLRRTGDLNLLPDHNQGDSPPPAWRYHEIWMEFRSELL